MKFEKKTNRVQDWPGYAELSAAPSKVNQSHFNSGAIPYFKLWWREAFIFRKRFSPKFLWSSALCWGFSNWFQIIYGRVNHLMTSINNATFQLRPRRSKRFKGLKTISKKWYQTSTFFMENRSTFHHGMAPLPYETKYYIENCACFSQFSGKKRSDF